MQQFVSTVILGGGRPYCVKENPRPKAGISKEAELLLDVNDNAGTYGAASPTIASLSRGPF